MRHSTLVPALAATALLATAASAASPILVFDGHALLAACSRPDAYYDQGRCAGYMIGVHDQYVLSVGWDVNICLSLDDGNSMQYIVEPVVAYLERDRRRLFDPASGLVLAAMKESFPCRPEP